MLEEMKTSSVEVLLYWVDNYLFNEKVGPFEKRLFDWWISEGFFCVSNFKNTETGVSTELSMLLGGSIYDITRGKIDSVDNSAAKESVRKKIKEGWDLIIKVKPDYYVVEDTAGNRQKITALLKNNIRCFEIVDFVTKQEGDKTIIKSVIIDVVRNR